MNAFNRRVTLRDRLLRWVRFEPTRVDATGLTAPLLFLLAGIAVAAATGRGRIGLTPLSYSYAHEALLIASGRTRDALTQYVMWPPGYPMMVAPLVWLGVSAIRAAWLVSVVTFGVTVSLSFVLGRRLTTTWGGALAAVLVLFNPEMLDRANIAMSEMLLSASMLGALLVLDTLYLRWNDRVGSSCRSLALASGVLLGWPISVRYIGVIVSLVALGALVVMLAASPPNRGLIVGALAMTLLMLALIPLRNILATGGVAGHPVGGLPADTFGSAFSEAMQGVRTLWSFFAERFRRELVDAATALGLVGLCAWGLRRFRHLAVGCTPLVYLLALCLIASHTRIDKMNDRFVMPILPIFVIAVVGTVLSSIQIARGRRSGSWQRIARYAVLAVVIPIGAVGGLAVARGMALVATGYTPGSDYSPHTVRYIRDTVRAGTMLAANQMQLWALTLDYGFLMIPWDQPADNWPRDYGIAPWTRAEALKAFVEKDVRYVVLFLGQTSGDRLLTRYSPGEYVGSSLLRQPLPEVAGVTRLPDGVVVALADRERLLDALRDEQSAGAKSRR